jgi:cyclopropane fatty-acyl-phospholipid synthase-like methyltransferase
MYAMADRLLSQQLRRMRRDWDRRARENARHYVLTGQESWSDEEFYRAGEITMEEDILNDLENICQGKNPKEMAVLEIGCGAGRVTRAFARFFGSVHAFDISREMVAQARRAVADFPNARLYRNNGKDLRPLRSLWRRWLGLAPAAHFDFAFSTMVFQHVPSRAIVESYAREVHALLRPGGLFKFQVQGSPEVERQTGDTWVGASFSEADARHMAERCGFEMRYQAGLGDQYYWLWFFKR